MGQDPAAVVVIQHDCNHDLVIAHITLLVCNVYIIFILYIVYYICSLHIVYIFYILYTLYIFYIVDIVSVESVDHLGRPPAPWLHGEAQRQQHLRQLWSFSSMPGILNTEKDSSNKESILYDWNPDHDGPLLFARHSVLNMTI